MFMILVALILIALLALPIFLGLVLWLGWLGVAIYGGLVILSILFLWRELVRSRPASPNEL